MNRIYRLVWNNALHAMQVASEFAHHRGGTSTQGASPRFHRHRLSIACAAAIAMGTVALPASASSCVINGSTYQNCTQGLMGNAGTDGSGAVGTAGLDGGTTANPGNAGTDAGNGTAAGNTATSGANGGTAATGAVITVAGGSTIAGGQGGLGGNANGGNGGAGGQSVQWSSANGGNAGNAGDAAVAKAGGDGGKAISGSGFSASNSGTILGGTAGTGGAANGGNGGVGGNGANSAGNGGNGGDGGNGGTSGIGGIGGAAVDGSNFHLVNQGVIIGGLGGTGGGAQAGAGGVGGLRGLPGGTAGTNGQVGTAGVQGNYGAGGVGVISRGGSSIITSNVIAGGVAGDTATRANAVEFSGGGNTLTLESGYQFLGNVISAGGDTLALGGNTSGTFDVSALVATAPASYSGAPKYAGFDTYEKSGTGTLTLTGTTTAVTPWFVSGGGTLAISSNTNLGATSGDIRLNSGTLETTASLNTGRNVTIYNAGGFNVDSGTTLYDWGTVSGDGLLTKSGAGQLILSTVNVLRGVNVDAGTLQLNGANSITGPVTIASAGGITVAGPGATSLATASNLNVNGIFVIASATGDVSIASLSGTGTVGLGNNGLILTNAAGLFSGYIAPSAGSLTIAGGSETFSGSLAYTGQTNINSGTTLSLTDSGAITGSNIVDNGTFDISGTNSTQIVTLSGNGAVNLGSNTLFLSNASSVFGGVFNGAGGLTINAGTESLAGVNTHTGATHIASGASLSLTGQGSLANSFVWDEGTFDISASTAAVSIARISGNGTVTLGNNDLVLTNTNNFFAGTISGNGGLVLNGGQEVLGGNNTYVGGTTISAGTLQLGNGGTTGSITGPITDNAALTFNRSDDMNFAGAISGSGSVNQNGAGVLTLSGANTYAGGTTIAAGTLQGDTASLQGNIVNDAALVFDQNSSGTFAGVISGTGSLTQSGTAVLTLTGANSYSGGTTISAGTVQGDTTSLQGNIADNAALVFDQNSAGTFAGMISGTGTLDKAGAAILTLDGNSSAFAGYTKVITGGLIVGSAAGSGAALGSDVTVGSGAMLGGQGSIGGNVYVSDFAHLAPGDGIGTLTVDGNLTAVQDSQLDFEFGAPGANFQTAGSGDSVAVGGNLQLGGTVLNVTDAGGFGPGLYNVFSYGGTLTETNGGITLGSMPAGDVLSIQNLTGSKQINLLNSTGLTLNLWNGNGLATPTQMGGGSGTWSTNSPNWTDANADVNAPMSPQPGFAIFGGAPGTVTVDDNGGANPVSALGMQFASDGYTLKGDTLTLVGSSGGAPIIRVGDGSTAGAAYTAMISNTLAGTDGLIKADLGTLVLAGANTYSGGTTINGGTLEAANNTALGTDSVTVDNTANQHATLNVDSGVTLGNQVFLNNGATLVNAGGVVVSTPGNHVVESDAGNATITNTGMLQGDQGVFLSNNGTVTNDGGSIIASGTMSSAIYVAGTSGAILNENAGSVTGGYIGVQIVDGSVSNTGLASTISGSGYGVFTNATGASVTNADGASIHSISNDAVSMYQGGTVLNEGGASITGMIGVRMSRTGSVTNQGGASISGASVGVFLAQGGTVINSDSTINGGSAGVMLAGASNTVINNINSLISGSAASVQEITPNGAVNLTNAGRLVGDVLLDSHATNAVTLVSGSTLQGQLYIGGNTASTLTLDGTGPQLYSSAVTGPTTFAGGLIKQGAGSWILDADLAPDTTTIATGLLQIGNGGTTGSITGPITDNAAFTFNRSDDMNFAGAISGSGSLTQNGTGVLTLTGANTYAGGTTIAAGTLQGDTTSLQGNITDNAALVFDQNSAGTFAGVISGSGSVSQSGTGVLTLTGANSYSGGTTISAGTVQGDTTSLQGNIADNAALVFDQNSAGTFAGQISGKGSVSQNGTGVLTLTGINSYTGGTTINAGKLLGDSASLHGAITNNAALVFDQQADGIFNGSLSGSGTLTKTGSALLVLDGRNMLTGDTTVKSGTLEVGDANTPSAFLGGNVYVAAGGTLRGHGTIGGNVANSGNLWPGGSIGTLMIQGNYTQNAGSTFTVDATPSGQASLLAVGGTASILGGSAVVLAQAGNWAPKTNYTILTAAGGVSGQFASASSSLTFLNPTLTYTSNAVNLSLQRNDVSFASAAQTRNQRVTASAADELGFSNAAYSALTTLDAPTARHAFDQLSGVIYPNTDTALIEDSRYVRDTINRHLLGIGDDGMKGSTDTGVSVWTSAWGHGGHDDSDGNAAPLQANGSGLLLGADMPLGGDTRLGAVLGHGQNSIQSNSVGSSAHVLADEAGIYGSIGMGGFTLRAGAVYSWQHVRSHRAIAFGNYGEWMSSEHRAQTAQAYVEGGYRFDVSPGQQLEPFINVARVRVHDDALQEGGGAAALTVASNSTSVNTATLGLRDTLTLDAAGGIHAHGSLGWHQAWGGLTPLSSMRFVNGSDSFGIAGVPVARHTLITDLGIDFKLAKNVTVDASYLGQFAGGVQDQGARMSLNVAF